MSPGDTLSHAAGGAADTAGRFRFDDPEFRPDTVASFPAGTPPPQLFSGHAGQPARIQPSLKEPANPDWFVFMIVLVIAYFTALRFIYDRVLRHLFNAFSSNVVTLQAVRDENLLMQRTSVLLSVLFYFTGGLFLYKLAQFSGWESRYAGEGFQQFFLFTVLLAFLYAVKLVLLKTLGLVFHAGKLVSSYIFNIFLINNIAGIVLLPVICLIAFLPPAWHGIVFYAAGFGLGLLWLYRIVRGIGAWIAVPGYSRFYLILYLCAFEIAPLFVIFKLV